MGWISERSFRTGSALYSGGPKKKGPLRKVINFLGGDYSTNLFGSDTVLLECGHTSRSYGGKRAICEKCREGKPIDDLKDWGVENPVKKFIPPLTIVRPTMPPCSAANGHVWINSGANEKKCKHCLLFKIWSLTKRCWILKGQQPLHSQSQQPLQ